MKLYHGSVYMKTAYTVITNIRDFTCCLGIMAVWTKRDVCNTSLPDYLYYRQQYFGPIGSIYSKFIFIDSCSVFPFVTVKNWHVPKLDWTALGSSVSLQLNTHLNKVLDLWCWCIRISEHQNSTLCFQFLSLKTQSIDYFHWLDTKLIFKCV